MIKKFESFEEDFEEFPPKENITYRVYLEETSVGFVEVEAKTEDEAVDIANEVYSDGNTHWGRTNVEFIRVEKLNKKV